MFVCLLWSVTFTGIDKHTSLLGYGIIYGRKEFYDAGPHCLRL